MSFNRSSYDKNAYEVKNVQSKRPGTYKLEKYYGQPTPQCFDIQPSFNAKSDAVMEYGNIIDTESELFSLSRKYSKDPSQKYPFVKSDKAKQTFPKFCERSLQSTYTRYDSPKPNREESIAIPRFESLCLNPQNLSRIHDNSYIGQNTQLYERDNFKPKLPKLVDQSNALPSAKTPYNIAPSCGCTSNI